MTIHLIKRYKSFGGWTEFYEHHSSSTKTPMRFSIYRPPDTFQGTRPVLYWLSGLTCDESNFMQKSGVQSILSDLGIYLVAPDTSPRGCGYPDEESSWSIGSGAGFYLDALREPWNQSYKMYSYISTELPLIINDHFSVDPEKQSIMGHSMGGHGALIIGLRNQNFKSISAFSPICNPINSPWGQEAFKTYLGNEREQWDFYDTCQILKKEQCQKPMLVDYGLNDEFIEQGQLKIDQLIEICKKEQLNMTIRSFADYDHSYYFIASFIRDHILFHKKHLNF